ncbi:DUF4181 domain-containing protein [Virgibacillus byunsanensis]|uniref:DUF4181 domain-containing protein n=1 Tax=Virgibacillus byunsanensis TaxID=570945 RepID=A0ABW3LRT4_9BACI
MEAVLPVLALFLVILNFKLSRWLFKERRKRISETDGEIIHRWVGFALGIIGAGVYVYITVIAESTSVMWFFLCFILLLLSYQSFMEWKYLVGTKQFVIPLILMVLGITCIVGIFYINEQLKYTTFQKVVADQLNEDSTVRYITIYINDPTESIPKTEASTTI